MQLELTAAPAPGRGLPMRIRLAENARIPAQPLTIVLTLTAPDGRQVGSVTTTVLPGTRDLAVALPVEALKAGIYRLKSTLSGDEKVFDSTRLEIEV